MTATWLSDGGGARQGHAQRLRSLISGGTTAAAGVYDGMSAVLAAQAGFDALYLSGAALSASKAIPDLGLLTLEEVTRSAREIVRASNLPLIVDCDTGFGEALNVMRAVRDLEEVGVACIQIEDQQFPKKCGHLNDKRVVSIDDMCRKVAAARKASDDMVLCARTDAAFISLEEAIDRAKRYADAGADLIFVEALTSHEAIQQVRREVSSPLLANMTEFGRTPSISVSDWAAYGYEVVIFPVSAFRVASKAVQSFYASLKATGSAAAFLPQMMTRAELYDTISYFEYEALDASIAETVLDSTADTLRAEDSHEQP
ncbi:methylisocitrate lyase [Chelativorans sp. AA-79]|uniref:methylisocitrate lyase n=1 Tax=Chelativorans sp. AA-79 TaxID=3028735 RepID=UPI0023F8DE4E|nr:methylisocitrate lyase [Chelativorans sp. AA-79]WEX10652.1 methylisocitrate lyase [Chelativorans sp. AA-79]